MNNLGIWGRFLVSLGWGRKFYVFIQLPGSVDAVGARRRLFEKNPRSWEIELTSHPGWLRFLLMLLSFSSFSLSISIFLLLLLSSPFFLFLPFPSSSSSLVGGCVCAPAVLWAQPSQRIPSQTFVIIALPHEIQLGGINIYFWNKHLRTRDIVNSCMHISSELFLSFCIHYALYK